MSEKKKETVKTVVLDSHALLAYFEKETGWKEVAQLMAEGVSTSCQLSLCNQLGSSPPITERVYGKQKAEEIVRVLGELPIELVEADRRLTKQAAQLKVAGELAYADCFAAGLALEKKGSVLTGDPEFERVEDKVAIQWLR